MRRVLVSGMAAALAAGALLSSALCAAQEQKSTRVPLPTVKITKQGEKCVEPTDEMRRNHMQKILHQRDKTMHQGIRTTQHSFKNCVNCHADPQTGSVLGKDGFCQSCHTYAAVTIDCFECHTDRAEQKTTLTTPAPAAPTGVTR